jgi:hypothetical protein
MGEKAPPRSFDSAPQALCHAIKLWGASLRMTILWEIDEKHPKQVSCLWGMVRGFPTRNVQGKHKC